MRAAALEALAEVDPARALAAAETSAWSDADEDVRSSATGRGVAVAGVRAVAKWAFAETDLERLEIVVMTDNLRSLRVAEKAGACRKGLLRARLRLADENRDAVMFSFVRGDPL